MTITRKKLIEVALPLEAINIASAREKSIRHGHPSTLHLWWARRPLAAARAVIFAQMVDDPSSLPDLFPTEKKQEKERQRLFKIIEDLVLWENTTNETVLQAARDEIWASWRRACTDNVDHPRAKELFNRKKLPAFHDPFAGGGSLPLEAQRLGLEAYASDLNPVAVLINKAMIEIPPKFAGKPPVNPGCAGVSPALFERKWQGAQGLAEDVRYYGKWMRDEAEKRIGHLYPKIEITPEMVNGCAGVSPARPDLKKYLGQKLTVIAWLWARTVKSPNPAFANVDVPLASTFMLSTKPGKEAYVEPVILGTLGTRAAGPQEERAGETPAHPGYFFTVKMGKPKDTEAAKNGTKLSRGSFRCLMSDVPIRYEYIDDEANAGRMGERLMAIVAEGQRERIYLPPTDEMNAIARSAKPTWKPDAPSRGTWASNAQGRHYGFRTFGDYFTPRQLVALTTFSDLVQEAREQVLRDALGARASGPHSSSPWHSRGYHPHLDAPDLLQSVTFRLHDSVPVDLVERWRAELRIAEKTAADSKEAEELRRRLDEYEDAGHGSCHLRDEAIAALVEQALLHFDGQRYRLIEWCVMPNHVHALIETMTGHALKDVVQSWKSYTAKEANKILGASGAFWMPDYFDRYVRDERHLAAVRSYIRENPVRAGLCGAAGEWQFGSAWVEREGERARGPRTQIEVRLT